MATNTPHTSLSQQQFEQLFKSHFAHLCNFAQQFVPDADTAKDITQKVYINLWEQREKMNPEQNIVSYLFTAVRNRCLNYIRDNKKYRSKVLDLDCGEIDLAITEDNFALEDLQEKIEIALSALPEKCRLVFEMSRFREMKYREIAEELGIAQKTVEAHMSKAMKSLRASLGDWMALLPLFYWT